MVFNKMCHCAFDESSLGIGRVNRKLTSDLMCFSGYRRINGYCPGHDLLRAQYDLLTCEQACTANKMCRAFTFRTMFSPTCTLKSGVCSAPRFRACCYTYFKRTVSNQPVPSSQGSVQRPGSGLAATPTLNAR